MIMSLLTKIRCGLVLALPLTAISLFSALGAQEPRRDQNKNNAPAARPSQERPGEFDKNRRDGGKGPMPDNRNSGPNNGPRDFNKGPMPGMGGKGFVNPNMTPPRPDKELEAWIKILAEKMTDRNDDIRNSARRALVSVGPAAMFSLKEMTESKDAATAVAARNVMMEIGRSTMQKNMMMQRGGMPFGGPQGMPGMGGWGKMNPQDMNRKAGPGGPPREGDQGNRPGVGKPEGDRKSGYGKGGSSREGDKNKRPEGRPEGDRKVGPEADRPKGDPKARPETGKPEGERKAGPSAGPSRDGDKGNRPDAGKPEGDRKAGPGAGPSRDGDKGKRPDGDRKGGSGRPPQN
ncbi:MAG: hypothetical protein RL553_58 [Planctomycetota bacterium]|jgi:hypothetical protein